MNENATVVLDFEYYDNNIEALLLESAFVPITTDPTMYLEKTTEIKIKESLIKNKLNNEQQMISKGIF